MTKKCSVPGCPARHYARGWCSHHYNTNYAYGDPLHAGVQSRVRSCYRHEEGTPCEVEGCSGKLLAKGLCRKHYSRLRKHGDPTVVLRGPNGEGSVKRGYVYLTLGGRKGRTVLAHRHIMEVSLGRLLQPGETVHHKNGIRSDNRLVKGHELHCPSSCCNLELWSHSQPSGQRASDKLKWAKEIIRLYASLDQETSIAAE